MPQPEWSVVIATYERPAQLARALEALSRQNYPPERFEVIVVNDGGRELSHLPGGDVCVRIIRQENAGPAVGRNTGVAQARGTWIAFTDDDCEPLPEWLSELSRVVRSEPECLLGGRTVCGLPENLASSASQLIQEIVYDYYNADPKTARFFASDNMALRAEAFRSLGGFDPGFRRAAAEDRDLCERWVSAGRRMVYVPEALVRHSHPLSLTGFIRQHFHYGRGAARFHRKRRRNRTSRMSDHTGFHRQWRSWLLRPWRETRGSRALLLMFLLLVWQAANAAGFLYGWMVDRQRRDG